MATIEPSRREWLQAVYVQAGSEIRNEDTVTWGTFSIALATNGVLVNAALSLWQKAQNPIPPAFKLTPFILGVVASWFTAYIIWRSKRYLDQRMEVARTVETEMANGLTEGTSPEPTGLRLYSSPPFRRPAGPHVRPLMIVALILVGVWWVFAAGIGVGSGLFH